MGKLMALCLVTTLAAALFNRRFWRHRTGPVVNKWPKTGGCDKKVTLMP
jgi:hypothetical protein